MRKKHSRPRGVFIVGSLWSVYLIYGSGNPPEPVRRAPANVQETLENEEKPLHLILSVSFLHLSLLFSYVSLARPLWFFFSPAFYSLNAVECSLKVVSRREVATRANSSHQRPTSSVRRESEPYLSLPLPLPFPSSLSLSLSFSRSLDSRYICWVVRWTKLSLSRWEETSRDDGGAMLPV